MRSSNQNESIKLEFFTSLFCLFKVILSSYSITCSSEKMKTWLIYIIFHILVSNFDPLLSENTFIASNKSNYFSIFSKKTKDNVMTSWTLPSIETNSNLIFFMFFLRTLLECNDLMTFFWNKWIFVLNSNFQLFSFKFKLITID